MKVTGEIIAHAAATILNDATADPLRSAWFQWLQKKQPERADQVAVTALDDALQPGCGRECPVAGFQIGPLQTLKDDYPTVA